LRRLSVALLGAIAGSMLFVPPASAGPALHEVFPGGSIQAAVDAAAPGDAVLVHTGEYKESVLVTTPDLKIRGDSRNGVVLNGEGLRDRGFLVQAPGVEIANLTIHDYRVDGVKWDADADHYAARYVTSYNNGDYGIFAFDANYGVFEDSYTSGNPDSGFYIGGCYPCHAVIQRIVAEHNGLGYSGTNAGGDLVLRDSIWRRNGAGIVPNALDSEPNGPQHEAIIENNIIVDNGDPNDSPGQDDTAPGIGFGIGIAGGNHNLIRNNQIDNSGRYGIVTFAFPSTSNVNTYAAFGNKITDNTITNSGLFDLALGAAAGDRNCFAGNTFASSDPPRIETVYGCSKDNLLLNAPASISAVTDAELVAGLALYPPRECNESRCPVPPAQPEMPAPTGDLPRPPGTVWCVPDASIHAACEAAATTVQTAVDAAAPGDAVLVGPGVYHEAVQVNTPRLVIRGLDRNAAILDGGYELDRGITVHADGVEVSNLTARHYTIDGVKFDAVMGYVAQYVTAYNEGLYGIYAFDSTSGRFEHSFAYGVPDGGFYIGQCEPCDAVLADVKAIYNGLGYSGTNASMNITIRDSLFVQNGGGILPNTLDGESMPPQHGAVIVGNTVVDSGKDDPPATDLISGATGIGIGIVGGNHNVVERNTVIGSTRYGIVLTPYPETTPNLYRPEGNIVRDNEVSESGFMDVAVAAGSGQMNCAAGNTFETSDPPAIETLYACGYDNPVRNVPASGGALTGAELVAYALTATGRGDYRTQPDPPADMLDPGMPDVTVGLPS
jgi:hypothetical protein